MQQDLLSHLKLTRILTGAMSLMVIVKVSINISVYYRLHDQYEARRKITH